MQTVLLQGGDTVARCCTTSMTTASMASMAASRLARCCAGAWSLLSRRDGARNDVQARLQSCCWHHPFSRRSVNPEGPRRFGMDDQHGPIVSEYPPRLSCGFLVTAVADTSRLRALRRRHLGETCFPLARLYLTEVFLSTACGGHGVSPQKLVTRAMQHAPKGAFAPPHSNCNV